MDINGLLSGASSYLLEGYLNSLTSDRSAGEKANNYFYTYGKFTWLVKNDGAD